MCISASDLIFAKSVMSTRIKYQKGGVCLPFDISVRKAGLERIICGADERRWRGLDRATHKFNRVLSSAPNKKHPLWGAFYLRLIAGRELIQNARLRGDFFCFAEA